MSINLNNAESSTSVWGMTRAIDVEVPSFVFNKQIVTIKKTGEVVNTDGKTSFFLGSYGQHHTNALVFDLSELEQDISQYYQQCVFKNKNTEEKLTIRFKNNYLLIPDNLTKKPGEYEIIFMLIERGNQGNIIETDSTEYFISNKFTGTISYIVNGESITEELDFQFTKESFNTLTESELIEVTNIRLNKTEDIQLTINVEQQLNKIKYTIGNKLDSFVKTINITNLWNENKIPEAVNWFLISNKDQIKTRYKIKKSENQEIKYWIPREWTTTETPVSLAFGFYGVEQGKEYFYITNFILLEIGENWLETNDFNFDITNSLTVISSTEISDDGVITNTTLYDINRAMLQASDD